MARLPERDRTFLGMLALVFVASAGATVYLCKAMSGGMRMPGGWTMSMVWMGMGGSWLASAAGFVGMWAVMMLAMMLPSLTPMLLRYRSAVREQGAGNISALTAMAAAGYFFVWAGFGVLVYPIGMSASVAVMRWPALMRVVPTAIGLGLLVAGSIQLTPWKARGLERCRHTADCEGMPTNARTAWKHGVRLGVDCSLCCAGLMTVLLVTGVMSLSTMAVLAIVITAERVTRHPEWIARSAGAVIIMVGILVMARV
jgi:predicted metal-binding membrane protein